MSEVHYMQLTFYISTYGDDMPLHKIQTRIKKNPEFMKRLDRELGSKLLRQAVKKRDEKIIDLVIEHSVDVNPLELAIVRGDVELVKLQLLDGVKLEDHPKWELFYLEKYLFELKGCENRKNMALALVNSVDVGVILNDFGQNLLHRLAYRADKKDKHMLVEVSECLIKAGVSINERDKRGKTPLHEFAARFDNVKLIEFLINQGADVNNKDHNLRTPLHSAASGRHVEILNELLARGADVCARDKDGNTALHDACSDYNDEEAIRFLVYKNPDMISAVNNYNQTPFEQLLSFKWKSNHGACVNFMLRELARATFEGFVVSKKDVTLIQSNSKNRDYFHKCLTELGLMWSFEFYEPYTYYSVFQMRTKRMKKKLVGLTRNFEFMIGCEKNLHKLSCYGDDMRRILSEATRIGDASSVVESRLTKIFGQILPDLVIKCLAKNLTVKDLPK